MINAVDGREESCYKLFGFKLDVELRFKLEDQVEDLERVEL
jgi:hypothetical protein